MDKIQKILHSEFDIEIHKENFINYLEVVIDENGIVHYAVPSHQMFLINYACKKMNISKEELNDLFDIKYDVIEWLCETTKCISVWNNLYCGYANEKQKEKLKELKKTELFRGKI